MSFYLEVGRSTDEDEIIEQLLDFAEMGEYPKEVEIENQFIFPLVEPNIRCDLLGNLTGQNVGVFIAPSYSALATFALNVRTIAKMNRCNVGVIIRSVEPVADDVDEMAERESAEMDLFQEQQQADDVQAVENGAEIANSETLEEKPVEEPKTTRKRATKKEVSE